MKKIYASELDSSVSMAWKAAGFDGAATSVGFLPQVSSATADGRNERITDVRDAAAVWEDSSPMRSASSAITGMGASGGGEARFGDGEA